jgi:hypothetical protein
LNEKHIQQILAVEQQASAIHDAAVKEAAQLPVLAEQEAQAKLAKAKQKAEEEARALLNNDETCEECNRILERSAEQLGRTERIAKMNHARAVTYVLARVTGMEKY